MYYYVCGACQEGRRRICSPAEAKTPPPCPRCGKTMARSPKGMTSRTVEVLDNGVMTKKLERLADAERLFHERAEATKKQQQGGD